MLMKTAIFKKEEMEVSVFGVFPFESSESDILNVFTQNEKVLQILFDGLSYDLRINNVSVVSSLFPEMLEDFDPDERVLH